MLIITNWDQAQVFQLMYYSPEYNNLQRGLLGFLTENDLILFQIVVAKSFDQIMQTRMLLSQIQDKMNDIEGIKFFGINTTY